MTDANRDQLRKGFTLGEWSVIPDQNLITRSGEKTHLEPKVMEVLLELAAHQGQVVTRDQLIRNIWETTFVTDEVLSRAVSLLRSQLGDSPREPKYVQTIPKQGYRLIGEVTPARQELALPESEPTGLKKFRWPAWAAIGAICVGLLVAIWRSAGPDPVTGPLIPPVPAPIKSVAIVPLHDRTDLGAVDLSGVLTDEIVTSLSKIPDLSVILDRPAQNFPMTVEEVLLTGRQRNVDAVLEGSVRSKDGNLRVVARLRGTEAGVVLWSETYDQPVGDSYAVVDKISQAIAQALELTLNPDGKTLNTVAVPEAYQLFLHGQFLWKLRGAEPLRKSIDMFQSALTLDPGFTRARIALARSQALIPFYETVDAEEWYEQALDTIAGLELKDNWEQAEVEALKGFVATHRWQWKKAQTHLENSLRLAPDKANTYIWYSEFLNDVGRNRDAVIAIERGRELDAASPVINDRLGVAYMWANDDIRAAEAFGLGSALGFSNLNNPGYIIFLLRQHRYTEIKFILETIHRDPSTRPQWLIDNVETAFLPENRSWVLPLAEKAKQEGKLIDTRLQFGLWILLGGIDQAYRTFDDFSISERENLHIQFIFTREGREFREDRRFRKLAERIGLTRYWKDIAPPDFWSQ